MNKLFFLLLACSFSLFLFCSELSNPFDAKSSNYISDSSFVDILKQYDSTIITRSFIYDTVVHCDTFIFDSIRIVNHVHIDTSVFIDTVFYKDTSHFNDTLHLYDTIFYQETLSFFDTTFYKDTFHFLDTFFHFDTLVHLDTTIDTIHFYISKPFLYLVNLSDSSVFTSFDFCSTYNLGVSASGVDPSIIQSYSIMVPSGPVTVSHVPPWSSTFNTVSSVRYTLSVKTDSGTFSNFYSLYCNPSSIIRGSSPFLYNFRIRNLSGLDKEYFGYAPVCTLWTDSSLFSEYPDRIGYLGLYIDYDLPGASQFEMYISSNGSYDTSQCAIYGPVSSDFEFDYEISDLYVGTRFITSTCRAVSPDTSLWSPWLTMVFVIIDGR